MARPKSAKTHSPTPPPQATKRKRESLESSSKTNKSGSVSVSSSISKDSGAGFIKSAPFRRCVLQLLVHDGKPYTTVPKESMTVIQEAAETYLTHLLDNVSLRALHAGRITVQPKDLKIIKANKERRDVFRNILKKYEKES